jgi:putative GTP pyrophosphokinase
MKRDNRIPDRAEISSWYSKLAPAYEAPLAGIAGDIKNALISKGLNPTIKYRIKSFESYFNKLLRRMRQNHGQCDPTGITDILGVRVIFPFLEEIEAAEKILRDSFIISASERKGVNHSFREFGYEATHLMLNLDGRMVDLAEDEKISCCEIQLSTILQDAWSEVEHELVYKAEFTPFDLPLKRKLAALNANLTLADIIFQEVRDYQRSMKNELRKRRDVLYDRTGVASTVSDRAQDTSSVDPDGGPPPSESMPEDTIDNILLKAITAHNEGRYAVAVELYSRLLESGNSDSVRSIIHNHRGMAYLAQADYGKAIEDFTRAVAFDPGNFRAFNNRGLCRRLTGECGMAIDDFTLSVSINPYQSESYYGRALAWYELGDLAKAVEDSACALNFKPESASIRGFHEMVRKKMFE